MLTTHYLEEAEELCNRIAMLKQGQLIALEDKATLLNKGKSRTLRLKLQQGTLPASLQPLVVSQDGQQYDLKLSDVAVLDDLLAQIKQAGVTLRDIEINKPDLEDIFVETMHGPAA